MLLFCGDGDVVVALVGGGEEDAGLGLGAVEIRLETGCDGTDGTMKSSGAEGVEPSERDLRESEEADLGQARPAAASASAGHASSSPMMPPPTGAAEGGGGGGTFHAVFLAAALPGSAPSACAAGSRRFCFGWGGAPIAPVGAGAGAKLAAAGCVGAAPPAAGDMATRGESGGAAHGGFCYGGGGEGGFWIAIY